MRLRPMIRRAYAPGCTRDNLRRPQSAFSLATSARRQPSSLILAHQWHPCEADRLCDEISTRQLIIHVISLALWVSEEDLNRLLDCFDI